MRLSSNMLEMHPQILKDKLRISKIIHKHYNPALYERENMKAIKYMMKLDKSDDKTSRSSLYKPYSKDDKGIKALLEKKRRLRKVRPKLSVETKRDETLSQLILNDFGMRFENEEREGDNKKFLERKNKVIDIMDNYYSKNIHKGVNKPDHLFMFKAKPLIPLGRILLELDKERDKNKIKCQKIRVGNSEVSLFSPVRGERDKYRLEYFQKQPEKNETEEIKMVIKKK